MVLFIENSGKRNMAPCLPVCIEWHKASLQSYVVYNILTQHHSIPLKITPVPFLHGSG